MPLSKKRDRERKKLTRLDSNLKLNAPQSKSSPSKEGGNTIAPPEIDADGQIIPEYY